MIKTHNRKNAQHFACDKLAGVFHVSAASELPVEVVHHFIFLLFPTFFAKRCICKNDCTNEDCD